MLTISQERVHMLEVKGGILKDIIPGKNTVIIHGCNCFHIMGAGIAAYLRKEYPAVYRADCKTIRGIMSKMGTYSKAQITHNLVVLNCYTQYGIGREKNNTPPVKYSSIRKCLRSINTEYDGWEIRTPKIGCGLAGGD